MIARIKSLTSNISFLNKDRKTRYFYIAIGIIATLISIGSFIYYFNQDLTTVLGDGRSRLSTANRVLFSQTPGLAQLGGVWLPLPSVLMIPTIWSDFMYYSGLSGSIPSMFFFVVAGISLCIIVFRITHDYLSSFISSLIFLSNPAMVYIQTTQMSESMTISLALISTCFLLVWLQKEKGQLYLLLAAFFTFLLTLTRYEGWVFAISAIIVVGITSWLKSKKWGKVEGNTVFFSTLALLGIVLWFIYNEIIFGDFLNFTHQAGSTKFYVQQQLALGTHLTINNLPESIVFYLRAVVNSSGWISLAFAFVGIFVGILLHLKRKLLSCELFIFFPLISLVVFHIFGLYTGQTYIVNRYGLYAIPLVAIFIGILLKRLTLVVKFLVIFLLIFQTIFLTLNVPASLEERLDFTHSESGKEMASVSNWINNHPIPGQTLISFFTGDNVIFLARLKFKKIIYEGNQNLWRDALHQPNKYVERVIFVKNLELDPIYKTIKYNTDILNGFQVVYDGKFYQVYDRVD